MTHQSRVLDLVVEWEECLANGTPRRAEELCRDCPELLDDLKANLEALAGVNTVLHLKEEPPGDGLDATEVCTVNDPPAVRKTPADTPRPNIPGYEILKELGHGGMGVVWQARQVALGRAVAIKAVLPYGPNQDDLRRRFLREAKAMAALQHPNIVQIHEVGEYHRQPYLVMEYVQGHSLAASLSRRPLPPRKAAELLLALARAVHAAHEQGVIHRDLKPGNILLAAGSTPKICDFGLARQFDSSATQTQTSGIAGTPSYMAPEQISGPAETQGPEVDIYALGGILYECLTGRSAFLADNPFDTMQLVLKQPPVSPRQWQPKTPRDLETICLKCLAKEPHRRYASALELAKDLERFLAGVPIHARPVGAVERTWRWCRVHPSVSALIMVTLLAAMSIVALVGVYNRRLSRELDYTEAARKEILTSRNRLHAMLTQEVASRLDGDLRELSAVPLTLATLLENHREWDEAQLEQNLRQMLGKNPLIFGLCVAMEPDAWRKGRPDFALYVYRGRAGLAVKQLVPPAYKPHYRQWDWYRKAKDSPRGRWTEPYLGEGGDRTPMVTFSAPIPRDGRFVGVVAADLSMEYFRTLRSNVDDLDLGPQGYCMVVTSGQQILAHQADGYEFPSPDCDLTKLPLDESFRELVRQWTRAAEGTGQAIDFSTRQPASFLFRRIPSANWTLITVAH